MGKNDKLLEKVLSGNSDKNISFNDLVHLLKILGFMMRNSGGSHHIFYKEGVEEIINIQPVQGKAKPYQVKQVRNIITKYNLSIQ